MAAYYAPYTEAHNHGVATVYSTPVLQILDSLVPLLGLSVLSFCFAKRMDYWDDLWSWEMVKEVPWSKSCVSLVFAFSWAFIFSAAVLQLGAGLSSNNLVCTLAIFSCVILYVCSKLFIYLFLIEKVYVVWALSGAVPTPRLKTPIFRLCLALVLPLAVVLAILILGRIAEIRKSDRVCVIGLTTTASATLLSYNLFMTIVLTSLFIWPLWTSQVSKPVRRVASRTLIASMVALMTSCANIAILTVVHGRQLGWICLSSCGTDVTLNALVVWWVSRPPLPLRPMSKTGVAATQELPPQATTSTISISPSGRRISTHASTRHSIPSQFKTYEQPGRTTSPKIATPMDDDEPTLSYKLENKGSGMLDTILEAWKGQGGTDDGSASLQVAAMTEEETSEEEEQDVTDEESGAASLGDSRGKPDR